MTVLGRAGVELYADSSGFGADVARGIQAQAGPIESAFDDIGDDSSTRFARAFDKGINLVQSALRGIDAPNVEILVDAVTEGAVAEIRGIDAPPVDVEVTADTGRAQAEIRSIDAQPVDVPVDADTSGAEGEIRQLGGAGRKAGEDAGDGLGKGILSALVALPIAGTVVGIGAAIGASLVSGLQNEVRVDLFTARTGLDEATSARFGLAAGEAYGNNFGSSIAENLDTARVAIQAGLLDPAATARDAQLVIEQLSGVAAILGTDIPETARAAGTAVRAGIAGDAAGAFDVLVAAQQAGLNVSDDLLETVNEYSTQFRELGLNGQEAFGLLAQGVRAGARDTDIAADALKEFAIRAVDGTELSAKGFEAVGLNAKDMTAQIAAGGEGAKAGLDAVLDGLRAIEDPIARDAAAVALFGTQAEDLGAALFALDVTTAAASLGEVAGAARGAIDALGDNAAGQLASAGRNIQIAADGIKGALAEAFAPQLEGFSTFVSTNREAVVTFLLDVSNKALDVGRAMVEAAATGVEAFGALSGAAAALIPSVIGILEGLDRIPGIDLSGAITGLQDAGVALTGLSEGSATTADALRTNLIDNGIDPVQARLNEFGIPQVAQAAWHDTTVALAADVAAIGFASDGTALQVDRVGASFNTTTAAGAALDGQIRTAVQSLIANTAAGQAAGASTNELTQSFNRNRESLIVQIQAMGFGRREAEVLASRYGAVPDLVQTQFTQPGMAGAQGNTSFYTTQIARVPGNKSTSFDTPGLSGAAAGVAALAARIQALPQNRTVTVTYREIVSRGGNTGGGFAKGGRIPGAPSGIDTRLTPTAAGEWIINAEESEKWDDILRAINDGRLERADVMPQAASATPVAFVESGSGTGQGGASRVYNVGLDLTWSQFEAHMRTHDAQDRVTYGKVR